MFSAPWRKLQTLVPRMDTSLAYAHAMSQDVQTPFMQAQTLPVPFTFRTYEFPHRSRSCELYDQPDASVPSVMRDAIFAAVGRIGDLRQRRLLEHAGE